MYPGGREDRGREREEGREGGKGEPYFILFLSSNLNRNCDAYFSWIFVYLNTRQTDYKKKDPMFKP